MNWKFVEEILKERICLCIKTFLGECGYDTFASIRNISEKSVTEIEKYINNQCLETVEQLDCEHARHYQNQKKFELLPGHSACILEIKKCLSGEYLEKRNPLLTFDGQNSSANPFSIVLQKLVETARNNFLKSKFHATYDDVVRFFSTYVFLLCGRRCYEFLCHCLPLPSISTICELFILCINFCVVLLVSCFFLVKCIDVTRSRIVEGNLRCEELMDYLTKLKTEKRIWVSEDATAITARVKYDPSTNQLVGLKLPINDETGCPVPLSFSADDEIIIREHLKTAKTNAVYLVMAQPLDERLPPFVLQMFGTNNDFTAKNCLDRWRFMKIELQKYGIIPIFLFRINFILCFRST